MAHLCTILGAIERRRCSGANCEAMYGVAGVLPMRFFTRNWHPSRGWDVTSQQLEAIPWAPSDLSGQCSINRPDVPSQAPHRSRRSIAVQNCPDQLRLKYPHDLYPEVHATCVRALTPRQVASFTTAAAAGVPR